MAKKGLGSGLGALLGDAAIENEVNESVLPLAKIEPRQGQPRTFFDEEKLEELAESIKEHGLIQPITVRSIGGGWYQIIAGERRWRASKLAGLKEVPVRIIEADDKATSELALVENLQREDLNPVEEAKGYKALMAEYGLTQEAVAERVGKSRPVIANAVRLLALPEAVLKYVEDGKLSLSHARVILELEDDEGRVKVAEETVKNEFTVRETAALIKRILVGDKEKHPRSRLSADGVDYFAEVEKNLTKSLGRKVRLKGSDKKGKIEIDFYSADDLEVLLNALDRMELARGKKAEIE